MTLGIEFPPRKLNVDMENPKVHAGTDRLVHRVLTRSPTEPDAIDTGRSWQAATYQHARLSIYSTRARLPAATSSRQIEATKHCLASRASTVCQGQPKKHAKQRLPSGTLLGPVNSSPSSRTHFVASLVLMCTLSYIMHLHSLHTLQNLIDKWYYIILVYTSKCLNSRTALPTHNTHSLLLLLCTRVLLHMSSTRTHLLLLLCSPCPSEGIGQDPGCSLRSCCKD